MKRYAIVLNGLVVNIIAWDGITPYNPGSQYVLVDLTSFPDLDIGDSYPNG